MPYFIKFLRWWFAFYNESQLRISVPKHAPVVDVGRPTNQASIINYYQFGVQINYLCEWHIVIRAVRPQTKKLNILMGIICDFGKSAE